MEATVMTRVLLVEDNRLYRACLRRLIERIEGCMVAAEAETGPAAIEVARNAPFDLITLDLSLPGLSGLEVLRDIKARSRARVLILTAYSHLNLIRSAEALGADGVCLKDQNRDILARAVVETLAGRHPSYLEDTGAKGHRFYYRECGLAHGECALPQSHRRPGEIVPEGQLTD
jgi:DNA-binding NarL/FixJ family response regulator